MKKLLSLFFVALLGLGLSVPDADAKRFGGGGSIGKQRSMNAPQQSNAAPAKPAQPPAAAPAPAQSGAGKWLGPLAGLAAGGLLASLFMGGAFDGIKMMDILMIVALAAAVFFILRMLRKPQPQPSRPMQYAGMGEQTVTGMLNTGGAASAMPVSSTRPAWFEDEPFLREAKKHFLRLQDDYDRSDLNDIREYVTPEMFAEINMQIRERGDQPNKTEVVTLNAAMQDVATEGDMVIASVHFSGMIREEAGGAAETFNEVWHIQKSQAQPNATWLVAGIQQV